MQIFNKQHAESKFAQRIFVIFIVKDLLKPPGYDFLNFACVRKFGFKTQYSEITVGPLSSTTCPSIFYVIDWPE